MADGQGASPEQHTEFPMIPMLTLSAALAGESDVLAAGEFRNNAYTMEKGEYAIHPFLKSHFGVADNVDVKVPLLGDLLLGPRGSVEIGLVQNDAFAVSIEPDAYFGWRGRDYGAGATGRATLGLGEHRLNLSAGVGYRHAFLVDVDPNTEGDQSETVDGYVLPVNVGFDLALSDRSAVRFVGSSDLNYIGSGEAGGIVGTNFNYASGPIGFSVGFAVLYNGAGADIDIPDESPIQANTTIIPVPTAEIWFRI
jgi:hypothetical protein